MESKKRQRQSEREREQATRPFFTLPFKENFLKPVDRETNKERETDKQTEI